MLKRIVLIALIAINCIGCKTSKNIVSNRPARKKTAGVTNNVVNKNKEVSIADKIIWTAVSYKGTPYKFGGVSKHGMDCSGLIYTSFKERNISIPRNSGLMYKEGYKIPLAKAKRGDLLFFKTSNKSRSKVNHVGIVTSANKGVVKFMHATSSKGVIESSMLQDYWRKAFIEAKRVL